MTAVRMRTDEIRPPWAQSLKHAVDLIGQSREKVFKKFGVPDKQEDHDEFGLLVTRTVTYEYPGEIPYTLGFEFGRWEKVAEVWLSFKKCQRADDVWHEIDTKTRFPERLGVATGWCGNEPNGMIGRTKKGRPIDLWLRSSARSFTEVVPSFTFTSSIQVGSSLGFLSADKSPGIIHLDASDSLSDWTRPMKPRRLSRSFVWQCAEVWGVSIGSSSTYGSVYDLTDIQTIK